MMPVPEKCALGKEENTMNKDLKETRSAINTRMFLLFLGLMLVMNSIMSTGRYGFSWLNIATEVEKAQERGEFDLEAASPQQEPDANGAAEQAITEKISEVSSDGAGEQVQEAAEQISEASTEIAPANAQNGELDLELLASQMKQAGITVKDLRILGILSLVVAVMELIAGLLSVLFSNRVDRSKILFPVICALFVVELGYLAFTAMKGALMLSSILYSLIIPGILLWFARKLRKYAKEDPKRVYVVPPAGKPAGGKNGRGALAGSGQESGRRTTQVVEPPQKSLHERAMMRADEHPDEDLVSKQVENLIDNQVDEPTSDQVDDPTDEA